MEFLIIRFVKRLARFFKSSAKDHLTDKDARSVAVPTRSADLQQSVSEVLLLPDSIVSAVNKATWQAPEKSHRVPVDIILCVHSKLDSVKRCLQTLLEFTNMPYSFILVDDGSDDETRKYLVDFALAEGAMLLRNDVPKGFALAADKGVRHSNADYVLLLSSGVEVEPAAGWLDRMVACAESDDLIGLVGPLSNYDARQRSFQIIQGEGTGNSPAQGATSTGIVLPSGNTSAQIYPRLPELNGFCLMIKRAVINQVGYLDGAGFGQWLAGETDYGLRAVEAGWQLAVADDVHVSYKLS